MARHAQITQNNKFAISLQYLKKETSDEVDFLDINKYESLLQKNTMILIGIFKHSQLPKIASLQCLYNISKKKLDEVYFLHVDKYQSLLQVDFNTLDIKVSNKAIRSLLMDMIKHSQSTRSNKFAISLQDVEKDVRNGANFLYTDKHQSLYKLALYFLMNVTKHVKSTQNRKLVIFLQYVKKKVLQLLLCSIVMQKIQIFYGSSVTFVISFF